MKSKQQRQGREDNEKTKQAPECTNTKHTRVLECSLQLRLLANVCAIDESIGCGARRLTALSLASDCIEQLLERRRLLARAKRAELACDVASGA